MEPTNPHNTPNPPQLPGVEKPNPAFLPGEETKPTGIPAPTGVDGHQELPEHWRKPIANQDALIALRNLSSEIQERLRLIDVILDHMRQQDVIPK